MKTAKKEKSITGGAQGLPVSFDTIVRTDRGTLRLGLEFNEEQLQYMLEVAVRTLLGVGALSLPEIAHIPTEEEVKEYEQAHDNYDEWKKKNLN